MLCYKWLISKYFVNFCVCFKFYISVLITCRNIVIWRKSRKTLSSFIIFPPNERYACAKCYYRLERRVKERKKKKKMTPPPRHTCAMTCHQFRFLSKYKPLSTPFTKRFHFFYHIQCCREKPTLKFLKEIKPLPKNVKKKKNNILGVWAVTAFLLYF